jgi:hypothetical protein
MFIWIVWESLSNTRNLISFGKINVSTEWRHSAPVAEHTYNQLVILRI